MKRVLFLLAVAMGLTCVVLADAPKKNEVIPVHAIGGRKRVPHVRKVGKPLVGKRPIMRKVINRRPVKSVRPVVKPLVVKKSK